MRSTGKAVVRLSAIVLLLAACSGGASDPQTVSATGGGTNSGGANGKAAYAAPWNGTAPRADWTGANGVELGTIDNSGTVTEIMFLAEVYRRSGDTKYRA